MTTQKNYRKFKTKHGKMKKCGKIPGKDFKNQKNCIHFP